MSKVVLLSTPWIKDTIQNIIKETVVENNNGKYTMTNEYSDNTSYPYISCECRQVQVLKVYNSLNALTISDRNHMITIFLTTICAEELKNQYLSLDQFKNSIIQLKEYHVSTVLQCASSRDLNEITQVAKISLPFCIQCSSMTFLGNRDISEIGDPTDINKDIDIVKIICSLSYYTLSTTLGRNQFPYRNQLPDAGILHDIILFIV